MKFKIATKEGIKVVEGRKFIHYIGAYGHWFAYCEDSNAVTHMKSGRSVTSFPILTPLRERKKASKEALNGLVASHGADRVNVILNGAKTIQESRE